MPRANRYHIPAASGHVTHRCHKQEFLLKFERDRKRWRHWLYEAKKRYDLCVLNYIVTSNHVHLLVVDTKGNVIPQSIQLIAAGPGRSTIIAKSEKVPSGKTAIMPLPWRLINTWQGVLRKKELWSESIAVGSEGFVEKIRQQLGARVVGRSVVVEDEGCPLKEAQAPYSSLFEGEMGTLRPENSHLRNKNIELSA